MKDQFNNGNFVLLLLVCTLIIAYLTVAVATIYSYANPVVPVVNTIELSSIHDREATQEEIAYGTNVKEQNELKANPPRAVIDTSKGLQFEQGVNNFNGGKEKWYGESAGRLIGTENFHPVEHGYLDKDDYYVIACQDNICAMGEVIQTSKGPAKRYDTCETYGVVDFYCDK